MEEWVSIVVAVVFIIFMVIFCFIDSKKNDEDEENEENDLEKYILMKNYHKRMNDRMACEGYPMHDEKYYDYNVVSLDDKYDKEISEYEFIIEKKLPKYKPNKKIKVLIGDYDIMSISNSINILKSMGIETKAARSGREIIKRISNGEQYDLIITNNVYTTGHCDGPDTLIELKKLKDFNTPVVVLTVSSGKRHLFMGDYGFDEYMSKLLTQQQVIEVLPRVIKGLKFEKIEETKKSSKS